MLTFAAAGEVEGAGPFDAWRGLGFRKEARDLLYEGITENRGKNPCNVRDITEAVNPKP